ncbi:ABC transporter substrate-binding protein [Roseomonas soli]|uniref:ABC transporter substrate-binding protein n=2 Tax=Neoroseomonas soli TaxID=1081025 RepID=A0A9X9WR10_9PROT|nr:ABC transporter substrate-binding protein [Neoroseomonas soli]
MAAAAGASLLGSRPAKAAAALEIGLGGAFTTIDPHFFHATPNHTVAMHMFERLVDREADGRLVPRLAESWTLVGPTLWEMKLRPGVRFHDGSPFTSDDVAFTFQRAPNVPNSPGGFGTFLRTVSRLEVVDPLTIRIHTHQPAPDLLLNLTYIGILSRRTGEGASTADYNSGKAAIGTGPYRFVSFTPGNRVELERHDGWWGPAPAWEKVTLRLLANPAARTAALLSGDVQVIDTPSVSDLARLREDPRISVSSVPGIRFMYVVPDLSREGESPHVLSNSGQPLPRNPFRDRRVREALSLAVQRTALAERVMLNTAAPTGQWMPQGSYSYAPSVGIPDFNIDRARQLLAEAGLPDGFRLTMHSPNDRYPNDARLAQAVAQMWSRIGVRTSVEALPWSNFYGRGIRQEYSMALWGWGSPTFEAGYMLTNCLATFDRERNRGPYNYGRYSNPDLDQMIFSSVQEMDQAKREQLLIAAVERATSDVPVIPLLMLENLWATHRSVTISPRRDERTYAPDIRPA